MAKIDNIIAGIIEREGSKFTNNKNDAGGPTKYGVTWRTLARYRRTPVAAEDVAALTESEARAIYYDEYVIRPGFGNVIPLSSAIAEEIVDTGVNCGVQRAAEWLQRSLNALNRRGRDYADIKVDGNVGPATASALKTFLKLRGLPGEIVLLRALNSLQGEFYISLSERRQTDEEFVYGWLSNRVVIA